MNSTNRHMMSIWQNELLVTEVFSLTDTILILDVNFSPFWQGEMLFWLGCKPLMHTADWPIAHLV